MNRIFALFIAILIVGLSLASCTPAVESETDVQCKYVVYCSLNDAQTGVQQLSVEDAKKMAREVITKRGLGYTEYAAYGGFVDGDKINGNDTLVYTFFIIEKEDADAVAAHLKDELNLASVLMEEIQSVYGFVE